MWPAGCQDKAQTIDSWAASIAPTSLSAPTDQNIIEPSEPPLAKIPIRLKKKVKLNITQKINLLNKKLPSCTGCHAAVATSFLCPLNVCNSSFVFRMSKILSKWSRDAVRSQFPFSFHFMSMTVDLWACNVVNTVPVLGSHNFTGCWLSLEPEAGISKNKSDTYIKKRVCGQN